ncbi:MAG TPA: DNA-protecting protein DprA [Eubacteriaceae bacterium]|nr:DNA-protecting protein DprA [Eubacteriaceae bacterium]
MNDHLYFWYSTLKGSSLKKKHQLLESYSIEQLYRMTIKERSCLGLKENESFHWEQLFEQSKREGIKVLSYESEKYPLILKETSDPPLCLFYKGIWEDAIFKRSLAMVGTRKASKNGIQTAHLIAKELAGHDITVVSGLAEGIDGAAHRGCLEGQGRTAAVLGSGIDVIYPKSNEKLYHSIIEKGGLILSEFTVGTPPLSQNFPQRNRIISGLGYGCIVVEAAEKSGSLITASFSLEQGREVYACPNDLGKWTAKGSNRLLKEGAKIVTGAQDVMEDLFYVFPPRKELPSKEGKNPVEKKDQKILDAIERGYQSTEEIVQQTKIPAEEVRFLLTKLEIKNIVTNSGSYYNKKP